MVQVERRFAEVRTPGAVFPGVRRLLVVRDDRLGDLVLTLPAVAALRRTYPEARLMLMVRPALRPLAEMVEGVDDVLDAQPDAGSARRQLTELRADLVICVSRGAVAPWAAVRARVPERLGSGRRWYSPLMTRCVNERRRAGERHELEYALSFAHRAGAAAGPLDFGLRVPQAAIESTRCWLASAGIEGAFVVLHPGSGGSCPSWPVEHFLRLATLLRSTGIPVVFSVGPADGLVREALEHSAAELRTMPRFEGGQPELAALLDATTAVTSNSTGPLHLAAALGTPTLGFYPSWPSCGVARWGPYASNGWALVAGHSVAAAWSRHRRRREGPALMGTLPPDVAFDCLQALIEGRAPRLAKEPSTAARRR